MKRAAFFLLLLCLASFSAAASGAGENGGRQKRIVLVPSQDGTNAADDLGAGITAFAKDHPDVLATVAGGQGDAPNQAAAVEDQVAEGAHAILVAASDPLPLAAALKRAADAGIATVTIGTPRVRQVSYDVEAYDPAELGRRAVDVMAAWMSYSGAWQPLVGDLSSPVDRSWMQGTAAQARAAYPGLTQPGDGREVADREEAAHDASVVLLRDHPELKAILASTPSSVLGAARAVLELGLAGKVGVFGNCLPSQAGDFITRGVIVAIWFPVPADAGYAAARAAYEVLNGRRVRAGMDLGRPGYENVTVRNNDSGVPVIYGRAWREVTRGTLKEWTSADGSYKP